MPDSKAGLKLLQMIKQFRHNMFVLLNGREVSPTNNGAEQVRRPCVVFCKFTNGF